MPKVLAQAGTSLADVYDVEGSVAGVEQLLSQEVNLVHEMGGTIFSERFSTFIRRTQTAATLQSVDIDEVITGLPNPYWRVLGVVVLVDVTGRLTRMCVNIRDPVVGTGREIPVWIWDAANSNAVRIDEEGTVLVREALTPVPGTTLVPSMGVGDLQPQGTTELSLRGRTSAFGAGTVTITALIQIGFAQVGGISSKGLPLPGW